MHLKTLIALSGFLVLTSCDSPTTPAVGSGNAKSDETTPVALDQDHSVTNPERLSAANLVGHAPGPLILIAGVDDTCPVHHEKMKQCVVPLVIDAPTPTDTEAARAQTLKAFPFGDTVAFHHGNRFLPDDPQTARIFQCASCIAGRKEAAARAAQTAPTSDAQPAQRGRSTFRF